MHNIFQTDSNNKLIMPTFVLCHAYQDPIDTLNYVEDFNFNFVENGVDEISFSLARIHDGKPYEMFDVLKDFQVIYIPECGKHYQIQVTYKDGTEETIKTITGKFLCKAELSQLILNNIEINTEADIVRDAYAVTTIYDEEYPNMSLLNRILKDKAPHYSVKYVSPSLCGLVRSFSIDGQSIDDFLTTTLAEEINCVVEYDSTDKSISLYDVLKVCSDCGHRGDYLEDVCPECGSKNVSTEYGQDTGIIISTKNIAEEITVETDMDSVKTCFNITGGDDMMNAALRAINPNGTSYIYGFSNDIMSDMPETLRERIKSYNSLYASLQPGYKEIMKQIFDLYDEISYYEYEMTGIPEVNTTAQDELNKLKGSTLGNIGIAYLSNTTGKSVVDNAVLGIARLHLSNGYSVKIDSSTFTYSSSGSTWSGKFTVYHYSDEEDIATSPSDITLTVTNDYETYVQQKLDKALANKDAFYIDTDWSKYSLEHLKNYESAYNSCLEALIQSGMNGVSRLEQTNSYNEIMKTTDGIEYPNLGGIDLGEYRDAVHRIVNRNNYVLIIKSPDSYLFFFKNEITYAFDDNDSKYPSCRIITDDYIRVCDGVVVEIREGILDGGNVFYHYYIDDLSVVGSNFDYRGNTALQNFPYSNLEYMTANTAFYPDLWTDIDWGTYEKYKSEIKEKCSHMIVNYTSETNCYSYGVVNSEPIAFFETNSAGNGYYFIKTTACIYTIGGAISGFSYNSNNNNYFSVYHTKSYNSGDAQTVTVIGSTYDYRGNIDALQNYPYSNLKYEQKQTDPGYSLVENTKICLELYAQYFSELKEIQSEIATREATITTLNSNLSNLEKQQYDIVKQLDFQSYLGEELYKIFCCYRRDENYSNQNYISDGLSNADLLRKAEELLETASIQLYKASQTKYTISGTIANFLLMKEFEEFRDECKLGNWIYVQTENDDVYKLRLNGLSGSYDSLEKLQPTFSNAYKSSEPIDMLKDTILKANGMASSYKYVSHQASSGNIASQTLADMMKNGLNASHYRIMNADNQDVVIDEHGILCRELDELTGAYNPEQAKFISNLLCYTDDGWETVKQAIGKITYTDPELKKTVNKYGVIADTIIAAEIYGSKFVGGYIYSENYWDTSSKGSYINLNNGTFSLGGGAILFDGTSLNVKMDNLASEINLVADQIILTGKTTFESGETIQGMIDGAYNSADSASSALEAYKAALVSGTTTINGGCITTGVIDAQCISTDYFTNAVGSAGWTICKHPTDASAAYIYGNNNVYNNVVLKTGGNVAFACGLPTSYSIGEPTSGSTVQIWHDGKIRCGTIEPIYGSTLSIDATSMYINGYVVATQSYVDNNTVSRSEYNTLGSTMTNGQNALQYQIDQLEARVAALEG